MEIKKMEETKETKKAIELIEVPTQTDLAFKIGEEVLNLHQMICRMANDVSEINKKL